MIGVKKMEEKIVDITVDDLISKDLSEYASYLGLDEDELEEFYSDIDFDDYSK